MDCVGERIVKIG